MPKADNSSRFIYVSAFIFFVSLTLLRIFTQHPWNDEAYHATPALNLLQHGHMGTSNVEEQYLYFQGINTHTYWNVPVYYLFGAPWFALFGFDLFRARLLSFCFGAVGLFAFAYIVRRLTGSRRIAALALLLTSTSFAYVRSASENRLETPTLALGMLAIAAWLHWREHNLPKAVFLSQTLAALSGLTHPMGILYFAALAVLTVVYDRRRLQWQTVALAAIPYVIGGVLWGLYILQAPDDFRVQFFGNIGYHTGASLTREPLAAVAEEIRERYMKYFGVTGQLTHPLKQLRGLQLIGYLAGFGAVLGIASIRRSAGAKALALTAAVFMIVLMLADGGRKQTYLVHVLPWLSAVMALAMAVLSEQKRFPGWAVGAVTIAFVVLQASALLFIARQRTLQLAYYPATEYLNANVPKDARIFGSSELGFEIGFDRELIDDLSLGRYSGKRADFIVVDYNWETGYGNVNGRIGRGHVAEVLGQCRLTFHNSRYKVFACPAPQGAS